MDRNNRFPVTLREQEEGDSHMRLHWPSEGYASLLALFYFPLRQKDRHLQLALISREKVMFK
jgi:hypothetical protein